MTTRRQIPEIAGVQDQKTIVILREMKGIIEDMTGRSKTPIVLLGANSTLAGVINKVNEIIARLQEE
jgi:hypothetical protein